MWTRHVLSMPRRRRTKHHSKCLCVSWCSLAEVHYNKLNMSNCLDDRWIFMLVYLMGGPCSYNRPLSPWSRSNQAFTGSTLNKIHPAQSLHSCYNHIVSVDRDREKGKLDQIRQQTAQITTYISSLWCRTKSTQSQLLDITEWAKTRW